MKICGIVCEYNPFHTGHKYQIDSLKEKGYGVVCVMSGSFTQRGECAAFPKEVRAEWALKNGADLVLELPFPFSSFGAEMFASAGVEILDGTGVCDSICFGSECGDLGLLMRAAEANLAESFEERVNALLSSDRTLSYAKARGRVIYEETGLDLVNSNDILAVEYIKAIKRKSSGLVPVVLERKGAGYDAPPEGGFASAGYLRGLISEGKLTEALKYMPGVSEAELESRVVISEEKHFAALASAVIAKGAEGLREVSEIDGGMEHLLYRAVFEETSAEAISRRLSAKHLTDAKIRRALLFALMGVTKDMMKDSPAFTRVLAANGTGYAILKEAKKKKAEGFALISGASHLAEASDKAKAQFSFGAKAERMLEIIAE